MFSRNITGKGERGTAIVEFAIVGTFFFTMLFGTLELGRLLWVHNELANASRRAARYAVTHPADAFDDAARIAVYGKLDADARPIVPGLTVADVEVTSSSSQYGYGMNNGTVTVTINYTFTYVVPLIGTYVELSPYTTVLPVESSGCENFVNGADPCASS